MGKIALKHIKAFDSDFTIVVKRISEGHLQVIVEQQGQSIQQFRVREGNTINVTLK